MLQPLLQVCDLVVRFDETPGTVAAVGGVNFSIGAGQTYCLVGESGCGKSLTARAILRLTPSPGVPSGRILFHGEDLLTIPEQRMRRVRGNHIGMIFQEPMTALNPVLRVGMQAAEPLRLHRGMDAAQARERMLELFGQVGIPAPQARYNDYPHQLSGGMRQRVMIAMALACGPELLLADEPTTALDVTIQGQILHLIRSLSEQRGMGVLLITHDLGVVAQTADLVSVMYAGRIVESAPVTDIFAEPLHPYTRGLMHSAPTRRNMLQKQLPAIAGSVPPPGAMPSGCLFHPRCPYVMPCCRETYPHAAGEEHTVACWLHTR